MTKIERAKWLAAQIATWERLYDAFLVTGGESAGKTTATATDFVLTLAGLHRRLTDARAG